MDYRVDIYAGTAGHSAWFSDDLGQSWVHPNSQSGMYLEARVWCMSTHPREPGLLYAGTDHGLFCWNESTTRWTHLPSPMGDVWSIAQDPQDPKILLAGTRPAGIYRSADGGKTWRALPAGMPSFSDINMGPTRVTQILFDPLERHTVWATVEVGGIYRSQDEGATWTLQAEGLVSPDVHGIAILPDAAGRKVLFASTNRGLHRSDTNGENWTFQALDSPWQYTRSIVARGMGDPTLFLTNGNGPPGSTGRLLRSTDYGCSWQALDMPGTLNSTPWVVATNPCDPKLIFMCTNLGQLFRSVDGGDTWLRLPHEFGEIRALHWRPTCYPSTRPAHSVTVRPAIGHSGEAALPRASII